MTPEETRSFLQDSVPQPTPTQFTAISDGTPASCRVKMRQQVVFDKERNHVVSHGK
jgi:hypothetical protein